MEKLREAEQAFREEVKNKLERTESGHQLNDEITEGKPIDIEKSNENVENALSALEIKTIDDDVSLQDLDMESDFGDTFKTANTALQHWLQLTYERERVAFNKKQQEVKDQFKKAKDMVCFV